MPYVTLERRELLDQGAHAEDAGDLTYLLYRQCQWFVQKHGRRFNVMAAVAGALICCLLEFYRRIVAPHEDKKIKENGDVV